MFLGVVLEVLPEVVGERVFGRDFGVEDGFELRPVLGEVGELEVAPRFEADEEDALAVLRHHLLRVNDPVIDRVPDRQARGGIVLHDRHESPPACMVSRPDPWPTHPPRAARPAPRLRSALPGLSGSGAPLNLLPVSRPPHHARYGEASFRALRRDVCLKMLKNKGFLPISAWGGLFST